MTDNLTLIIVAGITGVPLLINAVTTGLVRRGQTKLAFLAAAMQDALAVQTQATVAVKDVVQIQTQATVAVKDAVVVQGQETVLTKEEVLKVHKLVNSQMSEMRGDLDAANNRIADLIAKLPRRINGVKKPHGAKKPRGGTHA